MITFHPGVFADRYTSGETLEERARQEGFTFEYVHRAVDPPGVNRVFVRAGSLAVEILPSKGMSIGAGHFDGKPLLWHPLLNRLPHPDSVDLHGDLLHGGELVKGYRFIEYFTGGVVMFGLRNWGMPCVSGDGKDVLPLHGEVSNIPVDRVDISVRGDRAEIRGNFFVHDGAGDERTTWYRRGKKLYHVVKRVLIDRKDSSVTVADEIRNISGETMNVEWGYTIKLHPREGSEYLVPSRSVENRFGSSLSPDHEIWRPAAAEADREERGVIHKGLRFTGCTTHHPTVETLLKHPGGGGVYIAVPPAPYFLSWFSAGGRGSRDFAAPDDRGPAPLSVFTRSWNGVGPEFGASALDHDGNVDPSIVEKPLRPGSIRHIGFVFKPLTKETAAMMEQEIREYTRGRTCG